ncbi:MAG: 3-hydroxyacyl-CoA dehydrogenase NAD-binding domain-containing protein [Promethearchaeota archaeon]
MDDISYVKQIAVVGAGTMGREIAEVALMADFEEVNLIDISSDILDNARNYINKGLSKIEEKGKLPSKFTATLLMKKLNLSLDLKEAVSEADFIIEAIPEKMKLKQELFEKLGHFSPPYSILATNTSTMSITKIAEKCNRHNKVVGMHFFIPVPLLRLIEVIKGKKTSEETMGIAIAVGEKFPSLKGKRKCVRIEKESPGFIVNRVMIPTSMYISWLLDKAMEQGIPLENIDADFAYMQQMGPCAKWDYLGLDIQMDTLKYFEKTLSSDFAPGKVLQKLVNEGNLGRKTGKGICEWTEDGKLKRKPSEKANLFDVDVYMALQLNEACRLLEEGVVTSYKEIDDAILAAFDIPGPFGPGKRNYEKWCKKLEDFVEESGKTYFLPSELMRTGKFKNMK